MTENLNLVILCIILCFWVASTVKKHNIVACLFLIGLTQIGDIYPILGKIRIEYLVGILATLFMFLSSRGIERLFSVQAHINKCFISFVMVTIFSIPFAISPHEATHWFIYYFKRCFIYYFIIVVLLDSKDKINNFIWAYILGIFWLAAHAVTNYVTHQNIVTVEGVVRVYGSTNILDNPNGLANTIVQTLPLIYYMAIHKNKRWQKMTLTLIGVISLTAVFMTGSRGAFIGLVATLLIISLFSEYRKTAMIVSFGIVLIFLLVIGPHLVDRYRSILEVSEYDVTAESRIFGLIHGISMFIKRPILGVGIGCYSIARTKWFSWDLWPHNTFGQLIGELGLLGILAWSLLVYHTVKGARSIRHFIEKEMTREHTYFYYLMLSIEVSIYVRLVLGMTTHSLHTFFWYITSALILATSNIIGNNTLSDRTDKAKVQ